VFKVAAVVKFIAKQVVLWPSLWHTAHCIGTGINHLVAFLADLFHLMHFACTVSLRMTEVVYNDNLCVSNR